GNLYAGGGFTTAGGTSANRIAQWDGTAWTALGSGMNNFVYALTTDADGNLYAGGDFFVAGGTSVNRIAKWDGTAWTALGSGMNNAVNALTAHTSAVVSAASGESVAPARVGGSTATDAILNLYAGGEFTTADGNQSANIGQWTVDPPLTVTLGYFLAAPNDDGVRIEWSTVTEMGNAGFNLYVETNAGREQINPELIPSAAIDSVEPQRYAYNAIGVQGDAFFIELVGIDGGSKLFGPFALGVPFGSSPATDAAEDGYRIFLPSVLNH
ncbi:MAG: hypothetical protein KDD92_12755, partial [Caldilineaceae bacterium]|nr:hypothetical protein [Caldilineaceae bacterium]